VTQRKTVGYLNENGEVEVLDIATGEVVGTSGNPDDIGEIVPIQVEGGKLVHVQRGLTLDDIRPGPKHKYEYSPLLADVFCQKIAEGGFITATCKEDGMPSYSTINRWKRNNDDFRKQLREAVTDRAEHYADRAIRAAEETSNKDQVPAQRLKHDAYKWRATMDNPKDYSNQTKLVGDPDQPIRYIIETGIRRQGDPGFIDLTKDVTEPSKQLEGGKDAEAHDEETETKTETETT